MPMRRNPETGELWELRGGRWVPVSPQAEQAGPVQAAAVSAGARLLDIERGTENLGLALAERLGLPDVRLNFGAIAPGGEPFITTGDPAARRAELEAENVEQERALAPLEARHPVASFVGRMAPDLATFPLSGGVGVQARIGAALGVAGYEAEAWRQLTQGAVGAAGGAGGAMLGNMASRVAARIGRLAGREGRLTAELPEMQATGRLEVEDAGMSAAARQEQLLGTLEDAEQVLGVSPQAGRFRPPEDLTTAQRWAVREGEELGWRFEQADFSRAAAQLRASADAHPLLAPLVSANREHNRELLTRSIAAGLGLEDPAIRGVGRADLSPNALGEASERIELLMNQLHDAAGDVNARQVKAAADQVAERGKRGLIGSEAQDLAKNIQAQLENTNTLRAEDATLWRSQINDAFRRATSPTGRPDAAGAENLVALQNALDEAIESAVPRGQRGLYKSAREQYRLLTAVQRGQAVTPGGQLNVRTLATNLRRIYRREFGQGRDSNLGPAVRRALRAVRVARTFDPGIGDSGTATRMALQTMADAPIQSLIMSASARPLGGIVGRLQQVSPNAAPLPGYLDATTGGRIGGAIGRALVSAGDLDRVQ